MEIFDEETLKLSYDDFEPFCKRRRQEGHYILEVDLQDFKKQQLRVQIQEPSVLTITGERPLYDTRWSRFREAIKLPKNCKTNEIRAIFCGRILRVFVPEKITAFPASTENITISTSIPSNCLVRIQNSSSRLEITTKLALHVVGVLAVVAALGAYAFKYCHCDQVEN